MGRLPATAHGGIPENGVPVQQATAPIHQAVVPIQQTGVPMQHTGVPIQLTGASIQHTGVPIQQTIAPVGTFTPPNQANVNLPIGSAWSTTGLFDCHEDQANAVMTAFFPCVTFGQLAEVMDEGQMTCPLGSFIYLLMMPALCPQRVMGSKYRAKMRNRYNLVEAPYSDLISHVFCSCCSLCQEFRELKNRGLDPSLGWNGILAQRRGQYQNQAPNAPPSDQFMFK